MAYIQSHGKQYSVPAEGLTIGCYDGAGLRLPGDDPSARAIVTLSADGSAVIWRDAPDAEILVNGVQLGIEPSPILHGDRVELAGEELRFGEAEQDGSTQFIAIAQLDELARAAREAGPNTPTFARGGRLVSLTDGREYLVPDDGIMIGREVGNDLVISSSEVSRKHAEIVPMPGGYHLTDHSTNGLFVNGVRIEQVKVLGRGDVIKIGPEEFRFYADTAKAGPPPLPPTAPPVPAPSVPPPPAAPAVPAPFEIKLELVDAMDSAALTPVSPPAAPAAPAVISRASLGTLEVLNEGPLKGTKFEVVAALTHVGRGAHNDIVLDDDSVSDSHAKVQRRDGGWWIADQGSTNGTYVSGIRVQGEQRVEGAPVVRFGGVKMSFRPGATAVDDVGGTRAIAVNVDQWKQPAAPEVEAAPVMARKKGCATTIAFLFALSAAGASLLAVLLTTGR